ncbi:hypothetical protein ACFXQA_14775 [Microbacterium sp. P07]|uniref:hypothetical protein n=1 Tax=Microbacterium sp. P07 TaxID=3366952 RepID=UPI003746B2AC
MDFLTLERFGSQAIEAVVARAADERGLTNVFNTSLVIRGASTFVSFRAEATPGEKPFRAYLLHHRPDGDDDLVDLSARTAEAGIGKTADPKLVTLNDELYVTFNTGTVHQGENSIYLQRVHPTLGPPQRCVLAPRRMVEKNWGFFSLPGGEVGALYSVAPLTLLRLTAGTLGTDDELIFTTQQEVAMPSRFPRLHIGSQPLVGSSSRAVIAVNQQRPIPGLPRKIYFGRAAEIDLHTGRLTRLSRRALIHSWRAMLPQRNRHNPGLFSATYFAGLARADDEILLSYGINDLDFGIARIPEDQVWR